MISQRDVLEVTSKADESSLGSNIPNMMDPEGRERDSSIKSSKRIQEIKREGRRKTKSSSQRATLERGEVRDRLA